MSLQSLVPSGRDIRIAICSPDLDFVPALYFYLGCPSTTNAFLLKQTAGCEITATEYYFPISSNYYVVVEGTITSTQTGNFTLTVSDAECNGTYTAAPRPTPSPVYVGLSNPGSGSGEQCFPYAAPAAYYSVQCPGPMTVSRLEPVTFNGQRVCGSRYPTNSAWTNAFLPSSGTGTTQVQFSITNNSGKGPRGNCTFALTVVDRDGPLAQAGCPARNQEVTVAPNQCTANAPDFKPQVTFDASCMRPISASLSLTQSIASGTPARAALAAGETYVLRLYSSAVPNGAECPIKLVVRRGEAPQHAYASGETATPATLAGVVGGRPALVTVSLRYAFADSCPDHAKLCRLSVRQTGDAQASIDGRLVLAGSPYALWNQTCASDLAAVQLSPYVDPSFAGAPGSTVRTYSVMLTCAYGFGVESRLAWEIPVVRP
eukprot:tig00020816_g14169.t1